VDYRRKTANANHVVRRLTDFRQWRGLAEQVGHLRRTTTAARRLRVKGIHYLVVVDHGVVVGLLTQDVLRNRKAEGAIRVDDAMLRNITIASPEMTLCEVVDVIRPGHLQTAVPVVEHNRLVGIVTVSDFCSSLETDLTVCRIRRRSGGTSYDTEG